MKRIIFILIFPLIWGACSNEQDSVIFSKVKEFEITPDSAKLIAKSFFYSHETSNTKATSKDFFLSRTFKKNDVPLLYVFNIGENDGFVLISADKRAYPILGYTKKGHFDENLLPDGISYLINYYKSELYEIISDQTGKFSPVKMQNRSTTTYSAPYEGKLVFTTKWNQGAPYNYAFTDRRNVGCVVVAASQVMNYFEWPAEFNWDLMLDKYTVSSPQENIDAISKFMRNSWFMFGATINGGVSIEKFLRGFTEGYNYSCEKVSKKDYTIKEWNVLCLKEIQAKRPILYFAKRTQGDGTVGHCFVLHGYTLITSDFAFFDVNWGWGGYCDGEFILNALNPDKVNSAYSLENHAIINIKPNR